MIHPGDLPIAGGILNHMGLALSIPTPVWAPLKMNSCQLADKALGR